MRVLRIERTQERSRKAVEKTDQQAGLHGMAVDPIGGGQGLFKAAAQGNGCDKG